MCERRDIPEFPGYQVDTDGNVFSNRVNKNIWHKLKPYKEKNNHYRVNLCKDNKSYHKWVHVLVLETFVGPRPYGYITRHFPDNDTSNNKLENLQWGTYKENAEDKIFHNTVSKLNGTLNGMAKLTDNDIKEIRRLYKEEKMTSIEISKLFPVNPRHIRRIVSGERWAWLES